MESSLKEIRWAEHKYMNIHQPLLNPPPPHLSLLLIIVLVTSLTGILYSTGIVYHLYEKPICKIMQMNAKFRVENIVRSRYFPFIVRQTGS